MRLRSFRGAEKLLQKLTLTVRAGEKRRIMPKKRNLERQKNRGIRR